MARLALSPARRRTLRAFAEALFHHPAGPTPEQLDAVVDGVEAHLSPVSPPQRALLLLAIDFVGWLPLLLLTALAPFADLAVERRVRLLERMDRSNFLPLFLPLVAFKTLMSLHFFEQPAELAAMRYPGDGGRKRWLHRAA